GLRGPSEGVHGGIETAKSDVGRAGGDGRDRVLGLGGDLGPLRRRAGPAAGGADGGVGSRPPRAGGGARSDASARAGLRGDGGGCRRGGGRATGGEAGIAPFSRPAP